MWLEMWSLHNLANPPRLCLQSSWFRVKLRDMTRFHCLKMKMCFTTSAYRLVSNVDHTFMCIESNYTVCWASHACQVMVPLVLCFKTMWSVPDTVSWGADYESRTDSSMLVWLHKSIDKGPISGFQHLALTVQRCVDITNLFFQNAPSKVQPEENYDLKPTETLSGLRSEQLYELVYYYKAQGLKCSVMVEQIHTFGHLIWWI